jgi:hypothetical protein
MLRYELIFFKGLCHDILVLRYLLIYLIPKSLPKNYFEFGFESATYFCTLALAIKTAWTGNSDSSLESATESSDFVLLNPAEISSLQLQIMQLFLKIVIISASERVKTSEYDPT